jgi:hypothetical protein
MDLDQIHAPPAAVVPELINGGKNVPLHGNCVDIMCRMKPVAFGKGMPFGARINAIFSSDIGHFDVPDMLQPVPESYELVEDGLITPADFRDFTFANAVRLWGTQNPRFFEGTRVAKQAAAILAKAHTPTRAAAE